MIIQSSNYDDYDDYDDNFGNDFEDMDRLEHCLHATATIPAHKIRSLPYLYSLVLWEYFSFSIWYNSQSLPHPTKGNLFVKILAPSEKSWPCLSENIWHLLVFTFSVLPVSIFVDIRHHCWIPDRCTVKAWQWPGLMRRCHSFLIFPQHFGMCLG